MNHRGPDDLGLETIKSPFGAVTFGHTRLSIIDLSAGGHQPMHSHDRRYVIVFNGEIYNYKELRKTLADMGQVFRTSSDTEVLLACWAQWGGAAISKLRGMFAFAVFDSLQQTITCVRDAFGIKPFYYRIAEDSFNFSSELPSLLTLQANEPRLDVHAAYNYLVHGQYDNGDATCFQDLCQLPPGHVLNIDLRKDSLSPVLTRWWTPSIGERRDISFHDAADQLRAMFIENVRLHLRSDVPLGAALSGGIDSSAVVCVMRHLQPDLPIHTFSYIARDDPLSEEKWVDAVNDSASAVPHKVIVSPAELAADLDDMIRVQGEPFGSTSIYAQYRVFRLAKESGITVTLDGQGADELLAGYRGYPESRMRSLWEARDVRGLLEFLRNWPRWPGRSREHAILALVSLGVPASLRTLAFKAIGRSPAPDWIRLGAFKDAGVRLAAPELNLGIGNHGRRLMERLHNELSGGGLAALLRHGDRNSMRWSIESRVPFLTTDIAEFLLTLPEHYLISQKGETKSVFRAAMRGIVPDVVLDRRDKIGFQTPEQTWLRQLGKQITLWMEGIEKLPFLNPDACRKEVASIVDGVAPFTFRAWRLINYCRWIQVHGVRV